MTRKSASAARHKDRQKRRLRKREPVRIQDADGYVDRIAVLIDFNYKTMRGEPVREIGSGFLAKFGGHVFVLTAGHHLIDRQPSEITLVLPSKLTVFGRPPLRPIRIERTYEPDVGYLELSKDAHPRWRHMTPYEPDDFDVRVPRVGERLVLIGAPGAFRSDANTLEPERFRSIGAYTNVRRCPGNPCQRGFHVLWGQTLHVHGGKSMRMPDPGGVSGGPVLRPHPTKPRVVGLASAKFEGFERCEHVRSVLELLAKHPAASVRGAVAEVLAGGA